MCFVRPEHFTGVLLFLCIIYCTLSFNSVTYAASLNASEEIKRIFNGDRDVRNATESVLKGVSLSGIFAEGGPLKLNTVTTGSPAKKNDSLSTTHGNTPVTETILNSNSNHINSTLPKLSPSKTLPTKLNDTGSNLFLGVPEVIHINGTSSIKPRKGVYFNKIVPRKGVENNSDESHSDSCASLGENECYNSKELMDVDCNCCKEGNDLGKSIREKDHVECKNCKSVIVDFPDDKHICENICCYDKSHKANVEDFYKNITHTKIKKENASTYGETKDAGFSNFTKSSKHKPSITKVPYDVEAVTEILSKAKQKVFVPVLVSILLLPLIGILVFVILRKTKEVWDKRYYKRMDFLIDGMYQD